MIVRILQEHSERYPEMQIQDAAKLLYQSEFGGGHMIADAAGSLKRIQEEYESLEAADKKRPVRLEPIGGGMSRVYLSCLFGGLKAEVLNRMFVESSNHVKGTVSGLEEKIRECLSACREGRLPYPAAEAENFFRSWRRRGYPAIGHSDAYRKLYRPAYRVVEDFYALVCRAVWEIDRGTRASGRKRPFLVGIDGMSAGGKSTFGRLLRENFPDSNLFHMDDYFLQPYQRTKGRLAEAGGNVDYERFKREILLHLTDRKGIVYRAYDCSAKSLGPEIKVPQKPLAVIEGVYSQHPYFGDIYDLRVFLETSEKRQRERIEKRNGREMLKRFVEEWIPMENRYFDVFQIKEKSDLK